MFTKFTNKTEFKTNSYNSIQHKHIILFKNVYMFRSERPSTGHHYKNFKMKYSTVQIMLK